jgi:hypothetical protein
MTKEVLVRRLLGLSVKLALVGILVSAAFAVGVPSSRTRPVQAEPISAISLNSGICLGLGIAFGGLDTLTAAEDCITNKLAPDQMQEFVMCLRGHFVAETGTFQCQQPSGIGLPADGDLVVDAPIQIVPDDFAKLDPFDGNQFHPGQPSIIIAFVNDDFPVRFATNLGSFLSAAGSDIGKDVECNAGGLGDVFDADCDQNPATRGDGVVAIPLTISQDQLDAAMDSTGKAAVYVDVVQESVSFPIQLTAVGIPKEITLTPLFGKSRIQTGATFPTPGTTPDVNEPPDSTDCNFAATTAGVLGAVNSAEKTVIVAKALDDFGNEVVGAFIEWNFTQYYPDNIVQGSPKGQITFPGNMAGQGAVALPQTPTLDTGSLGISFPQFVCGGRQPGVLDLYTSFFLTPDPFASTTADETIQIEVVGPATDVSLTAEPPVIDCTGANTSTVKATFTNAAGDPVANGLDVNFEVLALGTANPLKADTTDGSASTTIAPFSGANGLTGDAGPAGVVVRAWANGQIDVNDPFDDDQDGVIEFREGIEDLANGAPRQSWERIEASTLVQCSGGPPPPGAANAAGGAAGAGSPATGRIRPPDTGSGGQEPAGAASWWTLAALAGTAGAMAAASRVLRWRTR